MGEEDYKCRDSHVPLNPSPKNDLCVGNQYNDDYELIPFLQSTQTWRWKIQEDQKQYAKNEKKMSGYLEE